MPEEVNESIKIVLCDFFNLSHSLAFGAFVCCKSAPPPRDTFSMEKIVHTCFFFSKKNIIIGDDDSIQIRFFDSWLAMPDEAK